MRRGRAGRTSAPGALKRMALEHVGHDGAARHFPVGVLPAKAASSVVAEAEIDAPLSDRRETDRHRRPGTPAAHPVPEQLTPDEGVPQIVVMRLDRRAASNDDLTPLQLVARQVDPLPEQHLERRLEPALPHEAFEIAVLAPDQLEHLSVDAPGPRVDTQPDESQKVLLASLQPTTQDAAGLGHVDPMAEEGRQPTEEPRPDPDLGQRSQGGLGPSPPGPHARWPPRAPGRPARWCARPA